MTKLNQLPLPLVQRAEQAGRNAIGRQATFCIGRCLSIMGTIVECEPTQDQQRSREEVVVFRFVIVCGTERIRREFLDERIPA